MTIEIEPQETKVVFRKWPNGGILALFPQEDEGQGCCLSYEHVGQHGPADYAGCIAATTWATPYEYAPLFDELSSIGYRLKVYKRRPRRAV